MKQPGYLPKIIALITILTIISGCNMPSIRQTPTEVVPILPSVSPTFTLAPQIIGTSPSIAYLPVIVTDKATPTTVIVTDKAIPTMVPLPTNTVCSPPAGWPVYTVQPGDSLFRIALNHGMTTEELQTANCLPDADTIFTGQTLYVPYTIPPTPIPPTAIPPTATQPVIPPDLKEQVSLDTGGEIETPQCPVLAPGISPQIMISQRLKDMYALCIYGFPKEEEITVEMFAPDSHRVATKKFPSSGQINGYTLLKIPLWVPVGAPTGSWSATAESASVPKIENNSLPISPIAETAINAVPVGEVNPFDVEKNCDIDQGHGVYSPGQDLVIRGTNFGADANLAVGIYLLTWDFPQDSSGHYTLSWISTQQTVINQGNFSIPIRIQPTDSAGIYWVFPVLDLNQDVYKSFDTKSDCYQVP
jgi:LysM repeat protein